MRGLSVAWFTSAVVVVAAPTAFVGSQLPIYGTYPGWVQGQGKVNINVEIFMDFLCSDSKAQNPIWNELLSTPWLDGTVSD